MGKEEIILKFEHVVKRFGGITASNDINIDVPKGSIYGIIGPNGAGKTTLFNMVTGVYDCTEGEIRFWIKNKWTAYTYYCTERNCQNISEYSFIWRFKRI